MSSPKQNTEKSLVHVVHKHILWRYNPKTCWLTALNLYLWGHLKALLCSAPTGKEETRQGRIFYNCQRIHSRPGICEILRQSNACRRPCVHNFYNFNFPLWLQVLRCLKNIRHSSFFLSEDWNCFSCLYVNKTNYNIEKALSIILSFNTSLRTTSHLLQPLHLLHTDKHFPTAFMTKT